MSMYTTGELAKLCGVSVRTVQYYDSRKLLIPSELSEGGRRLYSQEDLQKMKVICFLRELDLPINTIGELLREEHPENVIDLLLQEQEKVLQEEILQKRQHLEMLTGLRRGLKTVSDFSIQSIGDIAHIMENRKKLKKVRAVMLAASLPFGIFQWGSILYSIFTGNWWPVLIYLLAAVPFVAWLFRYYWNHISYICPNCHQVFKPGKKEMFFARHTVTTRRLTCTCCGHRSFCVETCGGTDRTTE